MKFKFTAIICLILIMVFTLTACNNNTDYKGIKGKEYDAVLKQGLSNEGASLKNYITEEYNDENKMIIFVAHNAMGLAYMIKSRNNWTYNRSYPLFDIQAASSPKIAYSSGGLEIKTPDGKEYFLAMGRIYDLRIKKITLGNDSITASIVQSGNNMFWVKIIDSNDAIMYMKAYDSKGKEIK